MNIAGINSCYIGPQISPEQFTSEHMFLFLLTGSITYYDGEKEFKVKPGECGIVRRNHLVKYNKMYDDDHGFKKVVYQVLNATSKKFSNNRQVASSATITKSSILNWKE